MDVIQGGAGTSTNMNANEVIANRALELMGRKKGDYERAASRRGRQHEPEHERRLSDGGQGRAALLHPPADRRDGGAAGRLRRQGGRVRRRAQDRAHAAPGRGADDAGAGVLDLRRHAGGGRAAPARGGASHPRDQSRRDRDRHRHHRPSRLRGARLPLPLGHHGHPARHRGQPRRGDAGCRRLRAALGGNEARRGQALQDLQRPAAAFVRAARGPERDQPAADAGGLLDHAGQGQSGHPRGRQPDRVRGDRQRRDGELRGRSRAAAAERLRADHRPQPVQEPEAPAQRLPHAQRALRQGHHRQPRAICGGPSSTPSASSPR